MAAKVDTPAKADDSIVLGGRVKVELSRTAYEAGVTQGETFRGSPPLGQITPRFYYHHLTRHGFFGPEMEKADSEARLKCLAEGLIGADPYTVELMEEVNLCAQSGSSVLITGETGTGKEVISRTIHNLSSRKKGSFVPVNCGGMPEQLIEGELFGYKKGAFTGAVRDTPGYLETANGGTLFLDEIGDMPIGLQAKLLRVLNDGSFFRLGDRTERDTDLRIIAATNREIDLSVSRGEFRMDLLYRLNARRLHIWPLYLRPGDLSLMIFHVIKSYNEAHNGEHQVAAVGHWLLQQATNYRWFGNVRELRARVEEACIDARERDSDVVLAVDIQDQLPDDALMARLFTAGPGYVELLYGKVALEQLPAFDLRALSKRFDHFNGPERRGEWTFVHRLEMLSSEERGEKPFQTYYDRVVGMAVRGDDGPIGSSGDGQPLVNTEERLEPEAIPNYLLDLTHQALQDRYIHQLAERFSGNVTKVAAHAKMARKTVAKILANESIDS
jgi:DNA-binding NtrC family response regulator